MKKIVILLSSFFILLAANPIHTSAKHFEKPRNATLYSFDSLSVNAEIEVPTIEVKYFKNGSFVTEEAGTQRSSVGVFIWFIVKAIVSGLIFEASKYVLDNYVSPYVSAQDWAYSNGHGEVVLINSRVVYDTGCWKPEFQNNPFCRGA